MNILPTKAFCVFMSIGVDAVQHYAVIKEEILPFAGWDES